MAKFLTELVICPMPDDDGEWYLDEALGYQSDILAKLKLVKPLPIGEGVMWVPSRYRTDLASVPRVPVAYWLYGNRAHRASVIHDFLYQIGAYPNVPRSVADDIFLKAMKATGHTWIVRNVMYAAVVAAGWACFKKSEVEFYRPDEPPTGSCDGLNNVKPSGN